MSLISAFLYAFNVIIEKKYISYMSSEQILFLMYFGAGLGLYLLHLFSKKSKKIKSEKLTKKEMPKVILIVICELVASFLIIEALKNVNASLVSLLSIFELIMTSICAYFLFNDPIERDELIAIILVVVASIVLNFKEGIFSSVGLSSLFVIVACLCWGIENNITALISSKEPSFFTSIKCGAVSILYLIIILIKGDFYISNCILIVIGFFTYGLSILAYALSTKYLGASKATLVFSFSPIFGVILAILIYGEKITHSFMLSLVLMIMAILFINNNEKK
ncbi:MAG: DMT family transporter [Bacilli bacterium]|nr:DMT family transporter [Bacilli bacterium]